MPASFTVTDSVFVAAAPALVWQLAGDFSRYPDWVDATLEVTGGDGHAFLGAYYDERTRIAGPIVVRSRWTVTRFDEDAMLQRHEGDDSPGIRDLWLEMRVTPEGAGSRFTVTIGATVAMGPLSGLVARRFHASVGSGNAMNVRTFARLATEVATPAGQREK